MGDDHSRCTASTARTRSPAVNPTLTIIANALRVGDHLAERIGTIRHRQASTGPAQPSLTPHGL